MLQEDPLSSHIPDYAVQLLDAAMILTHTPERTIQELPPFIATLTHQQAFLRLHRMTHSLPLPVSARRMLAQFTVQWGASRYGSLALYAVTSADISVLSREGAQRLAQTCGWILHLLDNELYLASRRPCVDDEPRLLVALLTPMQRQVLQLMIATSSTRDIAEHLHITLRTAETYQRRIYRTLQVSKAEDAILIGIQAGLADH